MTESGSTCGTDSSSRARRATHRGRTAGRVVCGGILFLVLLYVLLLVPGADPPVSRGAGKQPFLWKQDPLWLELENQFNQARTVGCPALASRINSALADGQRLGGRLAEKSLPPDDVVFTDLENNLFHLAPMIGACPDRLSDYMTLAARIRAGVKQQSRRWDLNAPSARQRLYRILFGTRMALEEVILQASPSSTLPEMVPGEEVPSSTPAISFRGVMLHSGDMLVSRGGAPTSALIARGNDFPGSFSHVALLHVDERSGHASVVESHIERGVAVASLEEYLTDKKLRLLVLRLRPDLPEISGDSMLPHKAAASSLSKARTSHVPYDFAMDYQDHRAQFCSEVVSAAYEPTGVHLWKGTTFISSAVIVGWLGCLGVRHFETQEPSDLEYDPQLSVVAEWRDRATLLRAHVDDAVTDVMLETSNAGELLPYDHWMLPITRFAKAYSALLNLSGRVGPIPEGMSATAALRVQKFQREHALLASEVLRRAEEFRKEKGYTPPFWELNSMARMARPGRRDR